MAPMRRWMLALLLLGAVPKQARAGDEEPAAKDTHDLSSLTGLHLLQARELDVGGGRLLRLEVGAEQVPGSDTQWEGKLSATLFLLTPGGKQAPQVVDHLPLMVPLGYRMEVALTRDALRVSNHVSAVGVKLEGYSVGGSSDVLTHYVLLLDGKLQLAVSARDRSDSGSGGPGSKSEARVETLPSRSHWLADIRVSEASASMADEGPEAGPRRFEDVYCWNGRDYEMCEPRPPGPELASVKASSVLKEKGLAADVHAPERAVDGLESTAWVEGAKGPGVGQSLELSFAAAGTLRELEVLAACGKTPEGRAMNPRLKQVRLSFSGGAPEVLDLQDTPGWQTLTLAQPRGTSRLKVEVLSVYPGGKSEDACLAELVPVWAPPPAPEKAEP